MNTRTVLILLAIIAVLALILNFTGGGGEEPIPEAVSAETGSADPQKPDSIMDAVGTLGTPVEADTSGLPSAEQPAP